jgi:hypothetical protein
MINISEETISLISQELQHEVAWQQAPNTYMQAYFKRMAELHRPLDISTTIRHWAREFAIRLLTDSNGGFHSRRDYYNNRVSFDMLEQAITDCLIYRHVFLYPTPQYICQSRTPLDIRIRYIHGYRLFFAPVDWEALPLKLRKEQAKLDGYRPPSRVIYRPIVGKLISMHTNFCGYVPWPHPGDLPGLSLFQGAYASVYIHWLRHTFTLPGGAYEQFARYLYGDRHTQVTPRGRFNLRAARRRLYNWLGADRLFTIDDLP